MNTNILGDFDPESQELLQGMNFLDLNQIAFDEKQNERQDPFASFRAKRSFEEISNESAMNRPFGKDSLFYTPPPIAETMACITNSQKWIYKFYQNTKASELISDYRKYDSFLEKSEGKFDDVYDFIIYIETDFTVNMGKVLLIKMSNAMIIDYLEKFKKNIDTTIVKQWSQSIYELNKSRKGFSATVDDIENAFLLEIQYRPKVNDGIIKLTNSEIVSMIPSQLSEKIREIKIDRENWDPTLKSDRYKLASLGKGVDSVSSILTEFKTEVAYCRKFLETINLFSPLTGKNLVLDGSIQFLKSLETEIASIIQKLELIKEKGPEYFAFFCGIIDGIIEFICGIIDAVFLILELIFSNALKDKPEFDLDLLELREGLEEFIEAWLDDPNFLDKKITEMMEAFEYSRRLDPKLTKYQVAHNNGEDLVLAIDLILSFIVIVKSLTNSSKYLPKFTEWIDEVVENGGKGARILENTLVDDYIRLSNELVEATKSKTLFQNSSKLDELYTAAKAADSELKVITTDFALESKGSAGFRDGLKSKERSLEKMMSEYDGDASRLVDIAGSKVVYATVDDLYIALDKFNKEYKILKIKDRIQQPLNGYRDILMNIEAKNGHIVEFRLHLKEMDEVADGVGHKLYEQQRSLLAKANFEKRVLTVIEEKEYLRLELESKKLYEKAWGKIINK